MEINNHLIDYATVQWLTLQSCKKTMTPIYEGTFTPNEKRMQLSSLDWWRLHLLQAYFQPSISTVFDLLNHLSGQ